MKDVADAEQTALRKLAEIAKDLDDFRSGRKRLVAEVETHGPHFFTVKIYEKTFP